MLTCPHCGSARVKKAGSHKNAAGERVQRYVCEEPECFGTKFNTPIAEEKTEGEREVTTLKLVVSRQKDELAGLKAHTRTLEHEVDKLQRVATIRQGGVHKAPPKWLSTPTRSAGHRGTLMTILSDTHLDEVVRPSEVDYLNSYNRDIAGQRLQRYFEGIVSLSGDYFSGVTYDGVVMMLGGDILSGNIHDELTQTNDGLSLVESIRYWTPRLAAGITFLAEQFGKVHVPVVVGNHPRFTAKPRAKLRALDNADWLIGQMLADRLSGDDRITFDVPDSTDAFVRVYDTNFLLTHGDQTSGGGGIGGIWPPVMRMRARKMNRYQASGRRFDHLVMGHYHQLIMAQGLIVNGSVVGWNEYAAVNNLPPERAQQGLWICTPEHGITLTAPIFCDNPQAEGWKAREKKERRAA